MNLLPTNRGRVNKLDQKPYVLLNVFFLATMRELVNTMNGIIHSQIAAQWAGVHMQSTHAGAVETHFSVF